MTLRVTALPRGQGLLEGPMNWRVYEALRELPGQKRWAGRNQLRFELSRRNLEFLSNRIPEIDFSDAGIAERLAELASLEQELATPAPVAAEASAFAFKTPPFAHQLEAFNRSKDKSVFALFMEMGTGKTKVTIDTAAYLFAQGQITAVLILAPNGVHRQWVTEQLPLHMPDWVPHTAAFKRAPYARELQSVLALRKAEGLRVYALNIESLQTDSGEKLALAFMKGERVLMICDESSRIKTPGALRTKRAIKLAQFATHRRILSGTPVTKGVEDLFSQLKFLNPDVLGFNSYWSFRAHFCNMGGFEGRQIVGYRNLPDLLKRLEQVSYRVMKEECLDLPEKLYVKREVEWGEGQKALYKQLVDELFVELDSGVRIEAPAAITRLIRLQQILSGHLPDETGLKHRVMEANPRIEATLELIQEAAGKVIVWARFHEDVDWLKETLAEARVSLVAYDGRTDNALRQEHIRRFMEDPECKVFLANPAAAGIGLNLTAANTVIYYSNSFDADVRWQSEDRCHRIGQHHPVTYYDLCVPGTIDTKILAALRAKKNIADLVRTGIRGLLDGRDGLE